MRLGVSAVLLLGLVSLRASAQARVDAFVSADSVRVGEPFTLSLVAEHQFNTEIVFPDDDAGPVLFGDLEVVARSDVASRYLGAAGPGTKVDSVAYTVRTFALDSVRVPPLPVRVVAGRDTMLAGSRAQRIPVVSVVGPDASQPRGLAPLAPFPQPMWPWVLLAVVVVSLIGLLIYGWKTRGADEAPAPDPVPVPEVDPYDDARTRLHRLEGTDLTDDAAVDAFYVELSNVLRRYLAQELDLRALERTTGEVVAELEAHPAVTDAAARRVRAVLELADLVKFADARPAPTDGTKALREARTALDAIQDRRHPAATLVHETRRDEAPHDAPPHDEARHDEARHDEARRDEARHDA